MTTERDDSPVLVEHNDAPPELLDEDAGVKSVKKTTTTTTSTTPLVESSTTVSEALKGEDTDRKACAVQIVSIGTAEDAYAFSFDKAALSQILTKVSPTAKVSVVSVVGAFRTGKSFLLSWFLRYLHYLEKEQKNEAEKDNANDTSKSRPWYKQFSSLGNESFDWRGGSDRNTTGVWMWSEPFVINRGDDKAPLAVLLVDTQGMFDHETTMSLTASIFGFSTLLSSYQIYNVDKQIQEDNLQQLALFSEYARAAFAEDKKEKDKETEAKAAKKEDPPAFDGTKKEAGEKNKAAPETQQKDTKDKKNEVAPETLQKDTKDKEVETKKIPPQPFQHIEFLVRDWQHFDDDDDFNADGSPNFEAMDASMVEYLEKSIATRDAKDLQETREQIRSCFQKLTCFGLCHPGLEVTKKKYMGNVDSIDPLFLQLLDRYCKRVFDHESGNLQPKVIHGHELTAPELSIYVEAYALLFKSGAKFPAASTLLEATATANNSNAVYVALNRYKEAMDLVAGPMCSNYVSPQELQLEHEERRAEAMLAFDSIANFGSRKSIEQSRRKVMADLNKSYELYCSLNESRNPIAGLEIFVVPGFAAIISFIFRWFTDATCSAQVCRAASDVFSHTYAVVLCFFFIIAATRFKQLRDVFSRIMAAVELLLATDSKPRKLKKE